MIALHPHPTAVLGARRRTSLSAILTLTVAASIARGAGGCASTGAAKTASYAASARANFEKGEKELRDNNQEEAITYFTAVKNRFPFSKYAALAELRIADAQFSRERYLEAADAYRAFLRAHPRHDNVQDGYASFRIGEAYYREIPSDWFLVPPSYEKDQTPTIDAARELRAFVDGYPDSAYLARGKEMLRDCRRRLAATEMYVADFYLKRGYPKAAVLRLSALLQSYPDTGIEPEALLLLGKTHMRMGERDKARDVFRRLLSEHAADYHAKKARLFLDHLDREQARHQAGRGDGPRPGPARQPAPGSAGEPVPKAGPGTQPRT